MTPEVTRNIHLPSRSDPADHGRWVDDHLGTRFTAFLSIAEVLSNRPSPLEAVSAPIIRAGFVVNQITSGRCKGSAGSVVVAATMRSSQVVGTCQNVLEGGGTRSGSMKMLRYPEWPCLSSVGCRSSLWSPGWGHGHWRGVVANFDHSIDPKAAETGEEARRKLFDVVDLAASRAAAMGWLFDRKQFPSIHLINLSSLPPSP